LRNTAPQVDERREKEDQKIKRSRRSKGVGGETNKTFF
jgi:hypothetical protein